jgi:hypothetical protein
MYGQTKIFELSEFKLNAGLFEDAVDHFFGVHESQV